MRGPHDRLGSTLPGQPSDEKAGGLGFGTAYQLAVGRFNVAGRSLDAYKRCTVYSIRERSRNEIWRVSFVN
jgi:hypothetical protein